MSYESAIEAAGATILANKRFGDWQGTMWTLVIYNNTIGWLDIAYGSCPCCDPYESWEEKTCSYDDDYRRREPTESELADFGRPYLEDILSHEEAIKKVSENLEWDMEAQEAVDWLNKTWEEKAT